jgi:hypothetical protein
MRSHIGVGPLRRRVSTGVTIGATVAMLGIGLAGAASAHPVSDGAVTISNIHVDGHGRYAAVPKGTVISVSFHYTITDPSPSTIDQIEVGFANGKPQTCPYDGTPGPEGFSASTTFDVTAPSVKGTYFLAYDRSQDLDCLYSTNNWWNGKPDPRTQYIATVTVY